VKKAIKKVASGLVRDAEKTWFSELSDKGAGYYSLSKLSSWNLWKPLLHFKPVIFIPVKCTKTHIYFAMKNCNGDANKLRSYMLNIINHYKVPVGADLSICM